MADNPTILGKAEQRRQQADARRKSVAAEVLGEAVSQAVATRSSLSRAAQAMAQAFPREFVERGLITFFPQSQPRVAGYDPSLLAPNPQRGRVTDRGLDELASSLDAHGQQEPIVARLITDTDRKRWPAAFTDRQRLLILKGHRIFAAQPKTRLTLLRVELMLPEEGEDDVAYSRRALRRASIKVMHSQAYDIFDKVNQYTVWREEFALAKPKDNDIAAYFEISRTEAQRVKIVAQLDNDVAQVIINSERRPADEVVFLIANRPVHEHKEAFKRLGTLTVAAARRFYQGENTGKAAGLVSGAGRPRNYVLSMRDEESDLAYIGTALTPQQWREKGGSDAVLAALESLLKDPAFRDRLEADLG